MLSILFGAGASFLSSQVGTLGWVYTILYSLGQVAQMCIVIFAIGGLMNLAAKHNRSDMVQKGSNILKVMIAIYIISVIIIVMAQIFRLNPVSTVIVTTLSVAVVVLSVVQYVLFLSYLGKSSKMLAGE